MGALFGGAGRRGAESHSSSWDSYRPCGSLARRDPYFFRDRPEAFPPERWRLLLQLDGDLPFFSNLGTDGIGYVLVRNDLRAGVFFWERPG